MSEREFKQLKEDGFEGCAALDYPEFFDAAVLKGLAQGPHGVRGEGVEVLAEGRHRVVVLPFQTEGREVMVAVKCFGKQSAWKDRFDRKRGSKASRSFAAARRLYERGVGTPDPLAYVDRWEGNRLVESYYFSAYAGELSCVRDELNRLYKEDPDCHRVVKLLNVTGRFIREMHDAGFYHKDLGNQNIMLRRVEGEDGEPEWVDLQVIDLNRGRVREALSLEERARDFDRLTIPGGFLYVLVAEYFKKPGRWKQAEPNLGVVFPKEIERVRKKYDFHARSRNWRHLSRWGKKSQRTTQFKNLWLWDDRSAQASVVMSRKQRKKCYPAGHHMESLVASLKAAPKAWPIYQKVREDVYTKPVQMAGRIGMSLEATGMDWGKQEELLSRLSGAQKIPTLVRFCHHESPTQWEQTARYVKRLAESGHPVMLAILQDRQAVLNPNSWRNFLEKVIGLTQEDVQMVEVCHAVNRTKWGVWSAREQAGLMQPVQDLQAKFPHLSFTGPACIDFEFHYVFAALEKMPKGLTLGALSHHLYVDRRGAPENFQGKFSLLEKCALLKAIALSSSRCGDEVIVSEVNWPVKGAGVWSPVNATYSGGENKLNVTDDLYGAYMLRYYVIALCSGMVERVYWWRLVAHGFGLVDECPKEKNAAWRERVGFRMLQFFLETVGTATFTQKIPDENDTYFFQFEKEGDQEKAVSVMAWANGRTQAGPWPFTYREAKDAEGHTIDGAVTLSDQPVYFLGVEGVQKVVPNSVHVGE